MNKLTKEYGLVHKYQGTLRLSMENTSKSTVILPLCTCITAGDPTLVNVNPNHSSFYGITDGPKTYGNSVINKYKIKLKYSIPVAGLEAGIKAVTFKQMLITLSFDDIDKTNLRDAATLSSLIACQKDVTLTGVRPSWNATDCGQVAQGAGFNSFGLTTDNKIECTSNFVEDTFQGYLDNSGISGLMKNVCNGGLKESIIMIDRPYTVDKWFDASPKVKRQNKNTFAGLLITVPQSGSNEQYYTAAETTAVDHLSISFDIQFTEYNDAFNQGI